MPLMQSNNISLINLRLITPDDSREHDLRGTFIEFTIFEDIFSPVLSAEVIVSTALSIDSEFDFSGQTVLNVEFQSTELGGVSISAPKIKTTFIVYKVESMPDRDKQASKTFKLYCISPEGIQNEKIKINRRFDGDYDETVENIFDTLESKKKLETESCKHNDILLIPNWKPIKAINYIANRALPNESGNSPANFLFFEQLLADDSSRFQFVSMSKLISNANVTREFERTQVTAIKDTAKSIRGGRNVVSEYLINSNNDYLSDIQNGVLSGETISVDLTRKRFDRYKFNYFEDFEEYKTLDKHAANAESKEEISSEAHISLIAKHNGLYDQNGCDIQSDPSSHIEESAWRRLLFIAKFEKTKSTIKVPGDTTTRLGDIVTWNVPNTGGVNQQGDFANKYIKNNWLVSSIAHRVTVVDGYTQTMELIKDSFSEKLDQSNIEDVLNNVTGSGRRAEVFKGSSTGTA